MKQVLAFAITASSIFQIHAQTNPAITHWIINNDNTKSRYYIEGNSTPFEDTALANVQRVRYSENSVYINATGLPAYIIGPYMDGNPSMASDNQHLFKIPLNPIEETGNKTNVPLGPIGVFINGVPMYDYKDGNSYQNQGIWNRDAIVAERDGFDCAKGHPSPIFSGGRPGMGQLIGGTYHHHQNPSAFRLDKNVISDVCDIYLADGLYVINPNEHSPILGYTFDGFPVYGAYGYANTDGTGGIKRIESSYQKRDITKRTHYADGSDVTDGPDISAEYPLGLYREDYEFIKNSGDLDIHNGRFCVTPEYPEGIYAYFATVDENWNSAYPYIVGPTYNGDVAMENIGNPQNPANVTIDEPVQEYTGTSNSSSSLNVLGSKVFPIPSKDLVVIQLGQAGKEKINIQLVDAKGSVLKKTFIAPGSTISHLDISDVYNGVYWIKMNNLQTSKSHKIQILH